MAGLTGKMWPTVLAMNLMLGVSGVWGQQIQWLQYHTARDTLNKGFGTVMLEVTPERPAEVSLPEFVGEAPLFARWSSPLAEQGYRWIALDRTNPKGPYDRLYIDADGDGSLKDESAESTWSTVPTDFAFFGPVKVVFQTQDGPTAYHLNLLYRRRADGAKELLVWSGCWYEGQIQVGPNTIACTLIDANANGTFNDRSVEPGRSDWIRLGARTFFAGIYHSLDGNLFELEIARDGAWIRLKPAENAVYGTIRLPEFVVEFEAVGENGLFILRPQNGAAQLPAGTYRIHRWTVERTDQAGVSWKLEGQNTGKDGLFEATPSGETFVQVGEPVFAELIVSQPDKTSYSFNQILKGPLGEPVSLTRNGVRPEPPKIRIKNPDGSYDRTYSLEYG